MEMAIPFKQKLTVGLLSAGVMATSFGLFMYLKRVGRFGNQSDDRMRGVTNKTSDKSFSFDGLASNSNCYGADEDVSNYNAATIDIIVNPSSVTMDVVQVAAPATTASRQQGRRRIRYADSGVDQQATAERKKCHPEETTPHGDFFLTEHDAVRSDRSAAEKEGEQELRPMATSSKIKQMDSSTALSILRSVSVEEEEEPSKESVEVFNRWLSVTSASSHRQTSTADDVGLNVFGRWYREILSDICRGDFESPHVLLKSSYTFHRQRLSEEDDGLRRQSVDVFTRWLASPPREKNDVGLNVFVNWYRDVRDVGDTKRPPVLQKSSFPFQKLLFAEQLEKKKRRRQRLMMRADCSNGADGVCSESAAALATRKKVHRVNKKQRSESIYY